MATSFNLPKPLRVFFSYFPLITHPAIEPKTKHPDAPTLWILPPKTGSLSSDVECLKWQAYLALQGIDIIKYRWDVPREGGINGVLPALHLPDGSLLGAQRIPGWADTFQGSSLDPLEGYTSVEARDESRAWVSMLEGIVHAALVSTAPQSFSFASLLYPTTGASVAALLQPPAAPLSGITTPLPPSATLHVPTTSVLLQYREAIDAISERLGRDQWLLGSSSPTALDALLFAYVYCLLQGGEAVRRAVERRVNLVTWERRVRKLVEEPGK